MEFNDPAVKAPEDSQTMYPLEPVFHQGLIALGVLGTISFLSSSLLFMYITYRLIRWQFIRRSQQQRLSGTDPNPNAAQDEDLSLGLAERHYSRLKVKTKFPSLPVPQLNNPDRQYSRAANPVLLLIYNLLFADIQQSLAFVLSLIWLGEDGIIVPSSTCWAQAWFLTTGKLASSGFLSAISVNTYLTIVRGYKPPQCVFHLSIAAVWIFSYIMTMAGIVATDNGKEYGGFYVRAGLWCWVNCKYGQLRLWLEYFWVFLAIFLTTILHLLIFIHLYRKRQSSRYLPNRRLSLRGDINEPPRPSGHHPAFLVYPIIYILCTTPLALARMLALAGSDPSYKFYCWAGSMLASHGWLNVVLWSTTILFIGSRDIEDTGLDRFAFVRTPHHRRFGNMIWVRGGNTNRQQQQGGGGGGPRRAWLSSSLPARGAQSHGAQRSTSEETLRRDESRSGDNGIQMEVVTTVVVESADSNPGDLKLSRDSIDKGS